MTSYIDNFSSIFTIEKPKLKVIEVSDWTAVQKVVSGWAETAKRRFQTAKIFNCSTVPLFNSELFDRLEDSKLMTEGMNDRIIQILAEKIQEQKIVFACVDNENKYQALALIDRQLNKIAYFVTHPNNIPTLLSKERVRGAGTKIILHLAKIALESGYNLRVYSIYGAESFYKKFGFEEEETSADLILTAAKIKKLISSKTPPFDQQKLEE